MKVLSVVSRRRDEKWKGKNSKGLIKEVATELGLGSGKIPAGGKGRGPCELGKYRTLRKHANMSDAQATNGKVGETRLECVLGPGGTGFEGRAKESQLTLAG